MLTFLSTYWFSIAMILGMVFYFGVIIRLKDDRPKKVKAAAWFSAFLMAIYLLKFPPDAIEAWLLGLIALMTGWAFGRSYRFLGTL